MTWLCLLLVAVACGDKERSSPSESPGTNEGTGATTDTAMTSTGPAFELCVADGPAETDGVSYAADIEPIFSMCVNCHRGFTDGLQFDDAYDLLVDVPSTQLPQMARVATGSPDQSYLWHKLCDTHEPVGGMGGQMPIAGSLSEAQMSLIRSWILGGAAP